MATRPHRAVIIARALASLVVVLVLLMGVPWALATFGGWPLSHVPSMSEIIRALSAPDDGTLLRSTLIVVGWVAWVTYAVSLLVEIPAHLMGVRVPRLPGLGLQQRQAAGLVAAIAALSTLASPAAAMAATHPADTHPHTATTQTLHTDAHSPASSPQHTTSLPDTAHPKVSPHTRTVTEGDTLWQIAREELGDGDRYAQIVKASADVVQPGGGHLVDPDYIEPGWKVVVPATTQASHAAAPDQKSSPGSKQVAPRTTASHPEVTAAPNGVTTAHAQPSHASDAATPHGTKTPTVAPSTPSPSATSTTPKPASTTPRTTTVTIPANAHAVPSPAVDAPTVTPPTSAPSSATTSPSTASQAASTSTTDPQPTEKAPNSLLSQSRTTYGLSAIGAALLILLLGRRRAMTGRHRRPGRRIKLPTGRAAITETQTRAGADIAATEYLTRALRTLGMYFTAKQQPLPALRAARLGTTLELYFTHPVTLPAPFIADPASPDIWILEPTGVIDLPPQDELDDVPAPWPTLVTLGTDTEGGQILVCLEEIGSLSLTGDTATSTDVMAALAAELIASPWADDTTQITLVGTLTDLAPHLGSPRVTVAADVDHALTLLQASADEHERVLAKSGAPDIAAARVSGEGWAPHLLLLALEPDASQTRRLQAILERMPRVAVAAVTTTRVPVGEWVLTITDAPQAILEPAGLNLIPQVLPQDQLADLVEAFAIDTPTESNSTTASTGRADHDPGAPQVPTPADAPNDLHGPSWGASIPAGTPDPAALPAVAAASLMDHTAATALDTALEATTATEPPTLPEDDNHSHLRESQDNPRSLAPEPHPAAPAPSNSDIGENNDHKDIDPEEAPEVLAAHRLEDLLKTRPLIRLLARTPQVLGTTGPKPESPGMATEALAYLALHPGQSHMAFSEALWPGQEVRAGKRNKLLSYARTWLGTTATGSPYVSIVDTGSYELDPSTPIDIDIFLNLIGDDATTTPLPRLRDALALVDGQPLSGVRTGRYAWAETDRIEICASIVDVAHILAIRSLEAGDPRTAAWAASKGLDADPIAEVLWRDALTAAHQAHDHEHILELTQRLNLILEKLDAEPEPATADLIDRLTTARV